jgi:CheY-like chemotaxis protein
VPAIVAFVDDLLFLSRIREAAKGPGAEVRAARTVEQLLMATTGSRLVLVDLDSPRLPTVAALAALKADPELAQLPVVGFFSHVHAERAESARQAGVGTVLPRSAFVQALPALLAK